MRYLLLFWVFIFCDACEVHTFEDVYKNPIVGIWTAVYNPTSQIEYSADGYFYNCQMDMSEVIHLEEVDGKYEEIRYGELLFKMGKWQGDSLFLTLIGSENGKELAKDIVILEDDFLVKINYKALPGIEKHIDEMELYRRENSTKMPSFNSFEKIIIPKGLTGDVMIAYDQKDGQPVQFDAVGNPILEIPKSGVLKTQLKENPMNLAAQRYAFFEKNEVEGTLQPLRNFQHGTYRHLYQKVQNTREAVNLMHHPDSTALFVLGFNQHGRNRDVRKAFGEYLYGNVINFKIDTVKNMFDLYGYSMAVKN